MIVTLDGLPILANILTSKSHEEEQQVLALKIISEISAESRHYNKLKEAEIPSIVSHFLHALNASDKVIFYASKTLSNMAAAGKK